MLSQSGFDLHQQMYLDHTSILSLEKAHHLKPHQSFIVALSQHYDSP